MLIIQTSLGIYYVMMKSWSTYCFYEQKMIYIYVSMDTFWFNIR